MIRMGTPGDPRLARYSERSFKISDPARARCNQALVELNDMAMACKSLSKHTLLFGSFYVDMFGQLSSPSADPAEDSLKKQNRAAYDATEVLLASLVRAKLLTDIMAGTSSQEDQEEPKPDEIIKGVGRLLLLDDPNDPRCRNTQKLLDRGGLLAELPLLKRGLQHYIDLDPRYDDPAEMLFLFIKGLQPLSGCAAFSPGGECCSNLASSHEVPLCHEHRCHLPLGPNQDQRCSKQVASGQRYLCSGHACMSTSHGVCGRVRFGLDVNGQTAQSFCDLHSCFKCVQLGQTPAHEAQDDPPRNVCSKVRPPVF
jgi:hypothetical protein